MPMRSKVEKVVVGPMGAGAVPEETLNTLAREAGARLRCASTNGNWGGAYTYDVPASYLDDFRVLFAPLAAALEFPVACMQHEGHCDDPFCDGHFQFTRPDGHSCSCHTGIAPCWACENQTLQCDSCGKEPEESFWQSY